MMFSDSKTTRRMLTALLWLMVSLISCCSIFAVEFNQAPADETNKRYGALVIADAENNDENTNSISDSSVDLESDSVDEFIPTKEWQKVQPGQAIPRGLHVRLNLQTGEQEAKLMDDEYNPDMKNPAGDEKSGRQERLKTLLEEAVKELHDGSPADVDADRPDSLQYWKNANREGMINLKNQHFTREELKQALKKFKTVREDTEMPLDTGKKFRSIEEIREDFKNLKIDMKTDLELLTDALERYRRKDLDLDGRRAVLTDLEYYLHQIDNAKNFADMGGLSLVVTDLNSTVEDIRSSAAVVISSAVQSNPSVQVAAIEAGAMQQLIRMLSTDSSLSVRGRSLAALSSLIRHFPYAQKKFVDLGGLQALSDLLTRHGSTGGLEKLCLKAVTLVADLLVERLSLQADETVYDKLREERVRQYAMVPLLESVVDHGWCQLVPKLLNLPEHDSREKVLGLMWILREPCHGHFSHHIRVLESLKREYSDLSERESENLPGDSEVSYFVELLQTIDNMISVISVRKEEL